MPDFGHGCLRVQANIIKQKMRSRSLVPRCGYREVISEHERACLESIVSFLKHRIFLNYFHLNPFVWEGNYFHTNPFPTAIQQLKINGSYFAEYREDILCWTWNPDHWTPVIVKRSSQAVCISQLFSFHRPFIPFTIPWCIAKANTLF